MSDSIIDCDALYDRLSVPLFKFIWDHRDDFDTEEFIRSFNRRSRWDMRLEELDFAPPGCEGIALVVVFSFGSDRLPVGKLVYLPDVQTVRFHLDIRSFIPADSAMSFHLSWFNALVRVAAHLESLVGQRVAV